MKGYVIFLEDVFDAAEFERYKQMSPHSIRQYGGKFIIRGSDIEMLEGTFNKSRVVVLEFPSVQAARDWHASDDYADAKDLRLKISKCDAILVAGV